MLNRRTLLGAAGASPLMWATDFAPAFADTPKDAVVMAMQIDDMISCDPQEAFEFSSGEVVSNMYEKLIIPNIKDPTQINPELAERWETSEDGLTTTFHLKPGRKFASGNPVTAEDVVFTYSRAVILNKAPGFIINQFGFTKENVAERITAPDPLTVVIKIATKQSPTFLFYCLSANVGGIVDKKTVMSHAQGDDLGNGWLKTNSAGSGPFALRAWRASENVSLDVNPNHQSRRRSSGCLSCTVPIPARRCWRSRRATSTSPAISAPSSSSRCKRILLSNWSRPPRPSCCISR